MDRFFTHLLSITYQNLINPMLNQFSEIWTNLLDFWGQAWWVNVMTTQPKCMYFFGPFADRQQASQAMLGYIEDLESESARVIKTNIQRCKPAQLTIEFEDVPA
jgi:Domain of unknown function (DUF1816)